MNRIPFGNRAQPCSISTPSTVERDRPTFQSPPRFRFAEWQRRGMVLPGMQPATLAKGYRWAHGGRNPKRDPERRATRAYTEHGLRRALGALIADNPGLALAGVWGAVLQRLPLPSTRLLLSQQARLRLLTPTDALVDVAQHWLPLGPWRPEPKARP